MVIEEIPSAKLKGIGDGFHLTLDPSVPESILRNEISTLFQRLQHLAINAKVVVDAGSKDLDDSFVEKLERFLKGTFQVASVSKSLEKKAVPVNRIRQRDLARSWTNHKSDVLMLKGRVRSGQKIDTRRHLIVAGDVNPGAELTVGGHIIVMGSLLGQASAGWPDDEGTFVIAMDFRPTKLQIGDVVAPEFDRRFKGRAVYASVKAGKVCFEDYLKVKPFKNIPWPTAM